MVRMTISDYVALSLAGAFSLALAGAKPEWSVDYGEEWGEEWDGLGWGGNQSSEAAGGRLDALGLLFEGGGTPQDGLVWGGYGEFEASDVLAVVYWRFRVVHDGIRSPSGGGAEVSFEISSSLASCKSNLLVPCNARTQQL